MPSPSRDAVERATEQARSLLRASFSAFASDHDDLIQAAHAYCCIRWKPERAAYEAFVTWKVKREALSLARKTSRLAEVALEALADHANEMAQQLEPFDDEDEAAMIERLKQRVLAECRERLLNTVGGLGTEWLADQAEILPEYSPRAIEGHRARAVAARKILAAVEGAPPEILETLPIEDLRRHAVFNSTWIGAMGSRIGIAYAGGRYGDDDEEAAVLSILSGHWPRLSPVMSAKKVIENEAEAIRKAREKRASGG